MSIFVDFLGYLASAAWLSGHAVREGKERKKAEIREKQLCRETDLFLDFRRDNGESIGNALGRPYHHIFPEYLRRKLERQGASWQEIRTAEDDWLARSETGIMTYLANRERRYYVPFMFASEAPILEKKQAKYMSWFNQAMETFPHYAVREIYIEDYPGKQSYYNAIEAYRHGEYAELEPIFGVSPPSDDPAYDERIREIFYGIDADGRYGLDLQDRYDVMRFLMIYRYHKNNWPEVVKYYTAMNRILAAEGVDQDDYFRKPNDLFYLHGKIMNVWQTGEKKLPLPEKLNRIREIVNTDTDWMDNAMKRRHRMLYEVAMKTLLRRDGYDPNLYTS